MYARAQFDPSKAAPHRVSTCDPSLLMLRLSGGRHTPAAVGGLGIVGLTVVVLVVLAIIYLVRTSTSDETVTPADTEGQPPSAPRKATS